MASKYIALSEETSGYSTYADISGQEIYFKILSESINTTREDYYPETTEFLVPDTYVDGLKRGGGDVEVLIDPNQWPKLLAMHLGDPTSSVVTLSGTVYTHQFTFGANEVVGTSGLKSFTVLKGVGIEDDRQLDGGFITDMEVEARAREVVGCTVSIVTDGAEVLTSSKTPDYGVYSGQRYLTFADAQTMTVGGTDRLTTAPTIEAFRLRLGRGYDTDHNVLGKKTLAAQTQHGVATVEGTMDFTFTSEDEHQRFLSYSSGTALGVQSAFVTVMNLRGDLISSGYYNEVEFSVPETHYTASEVNSTGRDRIVQTVNYRGNYNAASGCAAMVRVQNATSSYIDLINIL